MQLSRAVLFVHDAAVMEAFYANVFGLRVTEGDVASGFVCLADPAGGATLAIHATPHVGLPTGPRRDTCVKLCFLVEDIEAGRALLDKNGAEPGEIHRWDGMAYCDALDPEGNVIQITTRG